ncbi:glutathione-dependent formaldehyde-activating enzyme [Colletotrichum gloeosporioides Cg-14]|uniref:Glutathione-dependent formaldehyde-activating enzyme n=1 Tax=Colletotrichum gloeosporioides (strain Cg-14) TaxID=1237896 RepID=T0KYF6_COLGC|nr:glutathione-dependent formaldehyde-activating enzyme [Colletotrichum gloeosporioides Cg-14]
MVQACSYGAGVQETSKTVDVVYIRTDPLSAIDTAFLSSLSRTNELPRKKAFPNNISLSRVGSHSAVGNLQFHGFGPSPHLSDSTPSLDRAVTYKVDVDAPLITGYDHCDDCQRQSGSTYSLVVVVPKDKLTINGPTKSWAGKGSSGKAVHRIFCSECGSPIAHDPDAAPEIIALKGGTLDSEIKKTLKPDTEIWTVGKLPFCQEHLEKPFEHMPQ